MKYYYVYILQSEIYPNRYYTGFTEDLKARLAAHNAGQDPHTSKYKPWRIKTSIAFTDRQKALDFETYLKSPTSSEYAMQGTAESNKQINIPRRIKFQELKLKVIHDDKL
jgi:putative endonuclease